MQYTSFTEGVARLRTLTLILRAALALALVIVVLRMALVGVIITLINGAGFGGFRGGFALFAAAGVIGLVEVFVALLVAVLFLIWVWRAHANLHASGIGGLVTTPLRASLVHLVPVANLMFPVRNMRHLWNRSHGLDEWQANAEVGAVSIWWTAFVVAASIDSWLVFSALVALLTNVRFTAPLLATSGLALFSLSLRALAIVMLWRIVGTIARVQASLTGAAEAFA